MDDSTVFQSLGLAEGRWTGILRAEAPPARLLLLHRGQPVAQAVARPEGQGEWHVAVDLPPAVLAEGCHNLLLLGDAGQGDDPPQPGALRLGALAIAAGAALDDDLRAEMELLRAELELVKAELRRLARGA